ncbi:MAG: hypothetical protein JWO72_2068 [Caulobacteraceae bacterium]|jgi:hypothetical protein|nr:hypothetical protein [Caulobacteraceae bacterium]
MGITASWIAARGIDKAEVFARLGYVDTGEAADDDFELSYAQLPSGWLVVLIPGYRDPSWDRMEALCAGGEAMSCTISETVMYSLAHGYRDGRHVWSVEHHGGDMGTYHLDVWGSPPPELEPIRLRQMAKQEEDDAGDVRVDHIFDVPAELTYALCGYRADGQAMPGGEPPMTLLRDPEAGRRAPREGGGGVFKTLARWFGRG